MTDKMVVVGVVGAAFGIKGWVKITSYTEPYENILNYSTWYLRERGTWQEIEVEDSKIQAATLVAKFVTCNDRDVARLLTNKEIAVKYQELVTLPDGEHYWADLEGLEAVNLAGEILGKVDHLFNAGASDVLVVIGSDRTRYIPYTKNNVVVEVKLSEGKIILDWELGY